MWHGAIVDLPTGYTLCDGTGGAPDLRDRFIPAAGSAYNVGDAGDNETHSHSFIGDGHTHSLFVPVPGVLAGANTNKQTGRGDVFGTTDNETATQKYYALFYVMKL